MTTFFTSDLHLGHADMLAFGQRPWSSVEEHDAALIENVNATVGMDDELYVLGDFTLSTCPGDVRSYLDAIACRNRWLVLGNHDRADALFEPGAFVETRCYKELVLGGRLVCLSHYPMLDWNMALQHYGKDPAQASVMLHGHIHSCTKAVTGDNARAGIWRYDVGVDANAYKPVSWEAIRDFIGERDSSFTA